MKKLKILLWMLLVVLIMYSVSYLIYVGLAKLFLIALGMLGVKNDFNVWAIGLILIVLHIFLKENKK